MTELPSPECASCASRDAVIAELTAANAGLAERVARLERIVGRNSGNSSMPPSGDDAPGRTKPAPREAKKPGRGRGKQPGAPGSGLAWSQNPDEVVPHYPQGVCGGCGTDLADAPGAGVERSHQVHEVPLVTARVIQHDLHRVVCHCGRPQSAARPAQVAGSPASYGVNLQAMVVYMLVFQHVPVARCAQLVADVTGARPSAGFVHAMLRRAAAVLAPVVDLIKTLITAAHVAGFDETTLRCGKAGAKKKYVLSASTELLTALHLGGRDLPTFKAFGVLGPFAGVAVHDRYSHYDHPDFRQDGKHVHQLCASHLLRDIQDAAEEHPGHHWPAQAGRTLRALIGARYDALAAGQPAIPAEIAGPLIAKFRNAVSVGLSQIPRVPGANTKQRPGRLLLECFRYREADVLRFCADTRVWPTNNLSERDLRPTKTQQKISGRLTSEDATRDRLAIRSYLSTAAKHGVNMMTALRDAMAGTPWMPPLPAPP